MFQFFGFHTNIPHVKLISVLNIGFCFKGGAGEFTVVDSYRAGRSRTLKRMIIGEQGDLLMYSGLMMILPPSMKPQN